MLHFKPISQLVKKVKIVEVGPRDGLQNEKVCEAVCVKIRKRMFFSEKEELMLKGILHQGRVFTYD